MKQLEVQTWDDMEPIIEKGYVSLNRKFSLSEEDVEFVLVCPVFPARLALHFIGVDGQNYRVLYARDLCRVVSTKKI